MLQAFDIRKPWSKLSRFTVCFAQPMLSTDGPGTGQIEDFKVVPVAHLELVQTAHTKKLALQECHTEELPARWIWVEVPCTHGFFSSRRAGYGAFHHHSHRGHHRDHSYG